MFWYVILAVLALLLMIMIHELGHYIAGKILKFKINEFSIGFGPKLFSKKNKKTGEIFSLRLLPLGGFCAFEGEDEIQQKEEPSVEKKDVDVFDNNTDGQSPTNVSEQSDAKQEVKSDELKPFNEQAPWKRIIVLFAGAFFNFVSAIIFSIIYLLAGGMAVPVVMEKYSDELGNEYNYELMVGDEIIAVNGQKISVMNTYAEVMGKISGDTADFTVMRNGEEIVVRVTRQDIYVEGEAGYRGFGFVSGTKIQGMSFGDALLYSVPYTFKLSWLIVGSFGDLITGKVPIKDVTGPISTIQVMASATQQNWLNMLVLLPLIAANLAIFNILPIPALDGAKIVFTIIEWIRKKPINRTVEAYIHSIGFILLMGFCLFVEFMHFFL